MNYTGDLFTPHRPDVWVLPAEEVKQIKEMYNVQNGAHPGDKVSPQVVRQIFKLESCGIATYQRLLNEI